MRAARCFCVVVALLAACDDDTGDAVTRLDGGLDGGIAFDGDSDGIRHGRVDGSVENCARRSLCRDGLMTDVNGLCTRDFYGTGSEPSAGLYYVCLVDPTGTLYYAKGWRGDIVVTSPGWTHSAWSNGLVPSTLSATDEARCSAAKEDRADGGSGLCRP